MKFIKQLLILIAALISIILIVALFVKKDFQVIRSVEIKRSTEDVFDYVRYLENHEFFTVWSKKDPGINKTYSGPEGNVGSMYKWNSNTEDIGSGEQEITLLTENEKIGYELRFKKLWESNVKSFISFLSTSNTKTKLTWEFKGESPWPWNILLLFINMDEEIGTDLEEGLINLKNTLEVEG